MDIKPGQRALGIAESFQHDETTSTLAGAVVRADRVVDGAGFAECTIGGTDLTDAIIGLYERLGRADLQYLFVAGVALAWYNILDPQRLAEQTETPVIAVTFENSTGLNEALAEAFSGATLRQRRQQYQALPERTPVSVNGQTVYIRAVGIETDAAQSVLSAYTPTGGRPEPLRVARLLARGANAAFG